jgi:hypothetical protein
MSRKVIEIGGPGLGDSMSYRTLPARLTEDGHEVWLREPKLAWNNPEIKRMLWDRDPFVAGWTTDPASAFARYEDRAPRWYGSWTLGMENEYGCKPRTHFPTLPMGWEPKIRPEWSGKVFADVRSASQPFSNAVIDRYVEKLGYQLEFDPAKVVVLESPFSGPHGRDALAGNERISISGLDDMASAIASCSIMLTVESGTHAFASAVKGAKETPLVCSLFTCAQHSDRIFIFSNVRYSTTGFQGRDWHDYVEMRS